MTSSLKALWLIQTCAGPEKIGWTDQKLPRGISESAKDFTKVYRRNPCFLLGSAAVPVISGDITIVIGVIYISSVGRYNHYSHKSDLNCIPKYPWNVASPGKQFPWRCWRLSCFISKFLITTYIMVIFSTKPANSRKVRPGEETGILYQWSTDIIRYLRRRWIYRVLEFTDCLLVQSTQCPALLGQAQTTGNGKIAMACHGPT